MPIILVLAVLAVLLLSHRAGAATGPGAGSAAGGAGVGGSQPRFGGGDAFYSNVDGVKCVANPHTGQYDCSSYNPCTPPTGLNSAGAQLAYVQAVSKGLCPGHVSTPLGPPPPPPPPPAALGPPPPPPPASWTNRF
jgi:hypothetical protein